MALQKLEGVEEVEVSLNRGLAVIQLRPDNRVTVSQVREAIRSNGFSPEAAEVRVSGRILEQDRRLVLATPGRGVEYVLVRGRDAPELLAELEGVAGGRTVVLAGRVPKSARAERGLTLLEVSEIQDGT